tara:strand:- start:3050 stop:3379 length:330 start_codon:yes stop_codon:yes gene_type:complete
MPNKKQTFVSKVVKYRASANGRETISDFELTDVIQNVDEHTNSDDEFVLEFTKAVFGLFGWKYYTTEELKNLPQTDITYEDFKTTPQIGDDDWDPAKHFVDDDHHKQPD